MNRSTEFLNLYNQLDKCMRVILNAKPEISHAKLLEKMAKQDVIFQEYNSRLQAFRALRNSIVHIPYDGGNTEPIAEPNEMVLKDYRLLVKYLLNPPLALDTIATKNIFFVTWNTLLKGAFKFIQSKGFDTIPIIENGNIEGMYTQRCFQRMILEKMTDNSNFLISNKSTFNDIRSECEFSYKDIENKKDHPTLVRFVNKDSKIEFIEKLFKTEARNMQFIVVVCITPTGRAFEPLLGLVTPHNLPSANGSEQVLTKIKT